jgi:Carboxypeptidase regulatory-like domain
MKNFISIITSTILLTSFITAQTDVQPKTADEKTGSSVTLFGGLLELPQNVIAGGGGSSSTGGNFTIDGTIGQALAGETSIGGSSSVTSGFWNFNFNPFAGQGFEADVAPRTGGDSIILSNDIIQIQRFQIGLDQPDQTNELQRADSAPFASRGDNILQSNDVVQAQRYQIGLEGIQNAAGPGALAAAIEESQTAPLADHKTSASENVSDDASKTLPEKSLLFEKSDTILAVPRLMHVQNANGIAGQQVVVNILVDAFGDESAYGLTLLYNQAILTNPTTAIGMAGGSRLCNTAIAGRINCSINNFPNNNPTSSTDQIGEITPGNDQQLLRITFTVAANAPGGATTLTLSGVNSSDDAATNLTITSQNGTINVVGPTAASVSVGGRVSDTNGNYVSSALVTITDTQGRSRTARTNSFGYYHFTEVLAGETYIVSVTHKRLTFSPQVINVLEDFSELNFIALLERLGN